MSVIFREPLSYYLHRITSQYQMSPNMMKWIGGVGNGYCADGTTPILGIYQFGIDYTTCLYSFYEAFDLDTAVGAQLDMLGQFAGCTRLLPFTPTSVVAMKDYGQIQTATGTNFTLPDVPAPNTPVIVMRNGLKMSLAAGDYTIGGSVITFARPYLKGDTIDVAYFLSATAAAGMTSYDSVASAAGTTVTLPSTPIASTPVMVWRSGFKMATPGDYTISGATITFVHGYLQGDVIDVEYWTSGAPNVQEYATVATSAGTTITLPWTPAIAPTLVFRAGLKMSQASNDYTISGTTVTFNNGYLAGDSLNVLNFAGAGTFTPSALLDDTHYRVLLKATIGANFWDGTIDGLQSLWLGLFPSGKILTYDNQDMSFSIVLSGITDQMYLDMIRNDLIVPRPEGVKVNYTFAGIPVFGCDQNTKFVAGVDLGHAT